MGEPQQPYRNDEQEQKRIDALLDRMMNSSTLPNYLQDRQVDDCRLWIENQFLSS